ncbi:hypothetical protein L345_14882, partial [Ophiophagus hannah]
MVAFPESFGGVSPYLETTPLPAKEENTQLLPTPTPNPTPIQISHHDHFQIAPPAGCSSWGSAGALWRSRNLPNNTFIHAPNNNIIAVCQGAGTRYRRNLFDSRRSFSVTHCRSTGRFPNCNYRGRAMNRRVRLGCVRRMPKPGKVLGSGGRCSKIQGGGGRPGKVLGSGGRPRKVPGGGRRPSKVLGSVERPRKVPGSGGRSRKAQGGGQGPSSTHRLTSEQADQGCSVGAQARCGEEGRSDWVGQVAGGRVADQQLGNQFGGMACHKLLPIQQPIAKSMLPVLLTNSPKPLVLIPHGSENWQVRHWLAAPLFWGLFSSHFQADFGWKIGLKMAQKLA